VHYEKPDQPVGKQHFSSTCCRTKMVSELELTLGAMSERERLACLGARGPCSKCKRHVATLPPMFFFLKVVNDLASVNIDGQLLRVSLGDVELVELQNGSLIPWVDVESVKDRDREMIEELKILWCLVDVCVNRGCDMVGLYLKL